jgi:hypothetical protein
MNIAADYRWARLLTQQTSNTAYRLQAKENKLPYAENKQKFAVSVFR